MATITGERVSVGDAIVDYEDKVFPDHQANALYGTREIDMIEGVKPIDPRDVLDATITAWREGALTISTWTV